MNLSRHTEIMNLKRMCEMTGIKITPEKKRDSHTHTFTLRMKMYTFYFHLTENKENIIASNLLFFFLFCTFFSLIRQPSEIYVWRSKNKNLSPLFLFKERKSRRIFFPFFMVIIRFQLGLCFVSFRFICLFDCV